MTFEEELAAHRAEAQAPDPAIAVEQVRREQVQVELDRIVAGYALPAAAALKAAGVPAHRMWETGGITQLDAEAQLLDVHAWRLGNLSQLVMTTAGQLRLSNSRYDHTRAATQPAPHTSGWVKNGSSLGDYRRLGAAGLAPGQTVIHYGEPLGPSVLDMLAYGTPGVDSHPEWWADLSQPELCLRHFGYEDPSDEPLRSAIVRGAAALMDGVRPR